MVPSNGHLRQKEWHAQKENSLPTSQHSCHQRNTSHPVTFPAGMIGPSREEETAWNGYHSILLHPKNHFYHSLEPLQYHTAPQGYIASGDGYTIRYDEITSSISNKTRCVHNTLLWSDKIEDRRKLLSGIQLAGYLWQTWNHPQS